MTDTTPRHDGRTPEQLREVRITRNWLDHAEGSVLVEFGGIGPDTWGNTRAGASARTRIKRSDFGISWNVAIETGGVMLSDEVDVEIEISPLVSYAGEGLESLKGKTFTRSGLVESLEEFDALL